MAKPKSRKPPAAPDGQPPQKPAQKTGETDDVSQVDDPLIAGDAGKGRRAEADEPRVDSAGQLARKPKEVDLLH